MSYLVEIGGTATKAVDFVLTFDDGELFYIFEELE